MPLSPRNSSVVIAVSRLFLRSKNERKESESNTPSRTVEMRLPSSTLSAEGL
jgi:hypothetical protein